MRMTSDLESKVSIAALIEHFAVARLTHW
jgi:hypothetical protein